MLVRANVTKKLFLTGGSGKGGGRAGVKPRLGFKVMLVSNITINFPPVLTTTCVYGKLCVSASLSTSLSKQLKLTT